MVSNAKVMNVFWGGGTYGTNAGPGGSMPAFFNDVGSSPYFDWLTEYNTAPLSNGTHQAIGHASSIGETQISPAPANNGATIDDTNMQAELVAQLNAGTLPAPQLDSHGYVNTVYALYFPDGKTLTEDGYEGGVDWCAYHGTVAYQGHDVPYMVLPAFTDGSGYANGCGTDPTLFDDFTTTVSHELVETVTDAAVGLAPTIGYPLAWYDYYNGEIADICGDQSGQVTVGANTYWVQALFSNTVDDCIVTPPDRFSIATDPVSLSVAEGGQATITVTTSVTAGGPASVDLGVSGAPAGVTATPRPPR